MPPTQTPTSFRSNFVILYVNSPRQSANFYGTLLGRPAIEASDNFAMFALGDGVMLGLWAQKDVQPLLPI